MAEDRTIWQPGAPDRKVWAPGTSDRTVWESPEPPLPLLLRKGGLLLRDKPTGLLIKEPVSGDLAALYRCCRCGQPSLEPCCPCPTPATLFATFTQIAGNPCPNLDGLVYQLDGQLDEGEECFQRWKGAQVDVGLGIVDLEMQCDNVSTYDLTQLLGAGPGDSYLFNPDTGPSDPVAKQIAGSCSPFLFEYEYAADEFNICEGETGNTPIFRVVVIP